MGEEPRGDSSHVGLRVTRHLVKAAQVGVIRLDGTDEIAEYGGVEVGGESPTKWLEHSGGRLSGYLDRPARVPVINTVEDIIKVLKGVRIAKKGRDEVNLVIPGELVDELTLPAIGGGTGTESAGVSGEGRGKDVAVVLQLVGVIGIAGDVVTEGGSILSRGTRHHTAIPIELTTIVRKRRYATHVMSKEMKSLKSVPEFRAAWKALST